MEEEGVVVRSGSHELAYIAFDVVYMGGEGAAEAFERAGLQPCGVRVCSSLVVNIVHSCIHSH